MRNWVVGGALIPRVGGVELDGLVLVGNRRTDRIDRMDAAGWCHRSRRVDREGLAREVFEETGLTVAGWADLRYSVVVEAPQLGWRLRVEAWETADVVGDIVVADPDGIVEEVRQVAGAEALHVAGDAARSGCTCRSAIGSTVWLHPTGRSTSG